MTLTDALKGEHGAIYPLLAFIRERAAGATIEELRAMGGCLEAVLLSHAGIEDEILRPPIEEHLPLPAPNPDGSPGLTDHQVIRDLLAGAMAAAGVEEARRLLLQTIAVTYKHFEKEETTIFAIAERAIPEDSQSALCAAWACRRGVSMR